MNQPPFAGVLQIFSEAIRHHQAGRLAEAEQLYRHVLALDPDHADSLHLLGAIAARQRRHDLAIDLIGRAVAINPGMADYHFNLGVALQAEARLEEAVICYRRACTLKPAAAEMHHALGNALRDQDDPAEAIACYRRALEIQPKFFAALLSLGTLLKDQGQLDEAIALYRRATASKPDSPEVHNNLGNALLLQGLTDQAIAAYRRALDLNQDYAEAHNNLGYALQLQENLDQAEACFLRALDLMPDFPDAHRNLGIVHLTRGELATGWREYEWRWKIPRTVKSRKALAQPQWRGEAVKRRLLLKRRTLLIYSEQGLGDSLQFCRFAPLAAARGPRVIMQVQKPLVRLFRGIPGVDLVVGTYAEVPAFDFHCPMLSLPMALGITLATLPREPSYLKADAAQAAAWRTRLASMASGGLRVGVAWAGGHRADIPLAAMIDRRRSMPLERLLPLFELPGIQFFSLQKEGRKIPANYGVVDYMDEMEDFADTAALVANLDLVISVDTSIVHLAGALGVPVWVMDRFDSCWRWLRGRTDSPWYPALRLFRQSTSGDWQGVVEKIKAELSALARSHTPPTSV